MSVWGRVAEKFPPISAFLLAIVGIAENSPLIAPDWPGEGAWLGADLKRRIRAYPVTAGTLFHAHPSQHRKKPV
ncbi:hypothetical protein EIZ39_19120 [Ammoniphilus sp. CFH 90114]|nr:hypothetical protein EIZ39_19120 [Ammoniphilus sp. CFH 90114]